MNVTWIRWYVLLNVKILIIARPPSTNLSPLLSFPLLFSRGSRSNIGLYRTDEKECSILTRTFISHSFSLSIIFATVLVMRIIPRRADDLHPLPRDNSIQDGNSIGLTFVPPRCFPARYSVLRHAHGTWNDIIGIIGRVGWVATMAHIYNSRVAARMWKLGRGGRVLGKKEDGNNFEGEARIDLELSSARMGSRPTTLCTRYLTRFLASYTYSRLRIRIVQNNY